MICFFSRRRAALMNNSLGISLKLPIDVVCFVQERLKYPPMIPLLLLIWPILVTSLLLFPMLNIRTQPLVWLLAQPPHLVSLLFLQIATTDPGIDITPKIMFFSLFLICMISLCLGSPTVSLSYWLCGEFAWRWDSRPCLFVMQLVVSWRMPNWP